MSARHAILEDLTTGTNTVTELAEPFDMTMPAISKHLKVLRFFADSFDRLDEYLERLQTQQPETADDGA